MKKLSLFSLLLLLVGVTAYGSGWYDAGTRVRLSNADDEVVIGDDRKPWGNQTNEAKVYIVNGSQYFVIAQNLCQTARIRVRADDTDGCLFQYTWDAPIKFYNGRPLTERMRIEGDGDVGIGTTDPICRLHVEREASGPSQPEEQWAAIYGHNTATSYGPIGVYGRVSASNGKAIYGRNYNSDGYGGFFVGKGYFSGSVGIGTTDLSNYKLAVDGKIRAKEIKVETGWSDFVFADSYKLMPLDKLEKHIKVNKSLPGIPTEKEVLEGGVNLGEMQAKLLEKVEELTLYTIAQEKRLAQLEKENEELKNRISTIQK